MQPYVAKGQMNPAAYLDLDWEQASMLDVNAHCDIGVRDANCWTASPRRLSSALVD